MTEIKPVAYFRDRPASELTREELLLAFEYAAAELERLRGWSREARETRKALVEASKAMEEKSRGWF